MIDENTSDAEIKRLAVLKKLQILDTPYEILFDSLTKLAGTVCETPISIISLLDENRQWFKSTYGLENMRETPRAHAFCSYTILSNSILEVPDASKDNRFKDNPLVTGEPDIRFYAGAPIRMPLGEKIGAVCVIDTKAKQLTNVQKEALEGIAKVVSQCLMMRYNYIKQTDPYFEETPIPY